MNQLLRNASSNPALYGRRLEDTAYHEAGHAFMYLLLGRGFRRVSIVPVEDESFGRIERGPENRRDDSRADRAGIEREILTNLAGLVAAAKFRGRHDWCGAAFDILDSIDLMVTLGSDEEQTYIIIEECYNKCYQILDDPANWNVVVELAGELLARREMSFQEAVQVSRSAGLVCDDGSERPIPTSGESPRVPNRMRPYGTRMIKERIFVFFQFEALRKAG